MDCDDWKITCYVATTRHGRSLKPEERTLQGWRGANQIPLKVGRTAMSATVNFKPHGKNMGCQLVYRDNDGQVHYSVPVKQGKCTIPIKAVMNDVVIAVICNMDYVYEDEISRTRKYDYTLELGPGISDTADIYTRWYDYSPSSHQVRAAAGAKGSIHPSGTLSVDDGASQSFNFVSDRGCEVDQVILNGFPIGLMESYAFNEVHGDHTIAVTFRRK